MLNNDTLLVLPTLDEQKNLEVLIPAVLQNYPEFDLLIIDDGSMDGTLPYLIALSKNSTTVKFINRGAKLGIGSAHLQGLIYASEKQYKYIVTMDADQTHRVIDLGALLKIRHEMPSMVIGSRYIRGGGVFGWSLLRNTLTRLGHLATSIFFGTSLDMSSGMRIYRTSEIPLQILRREAPANYDFFFVSVLVYKKLRLPIGQVPIQLDPRGYGNSKMSPILMIKGILKLFKIGFRISKINIS
jgi:dolichol-phosphate mannosyltransferase